MLKINDDCEAEINLVPRCSCGYGIKRNEIKLYHWLFYAIQKCILFPKTVVAIVTPNKKQNKVIKFKNGSSIEIITPTENSDTIRGHRAEYPYVWFDYESYDKEMVDEVLKPFMRNIDNDK